jgi:hypothetical protein
MSAQAKIPKPFPLQFNFALIVIGYVLTLFAAVAGVVAFPFSMISLILLWIVVGAFFVVSVPIILLADVFLVVGFYRAIMELGRRLFFRQDPYSESQSMSKTSFMDKDLASEPTDTGVWDPWIDDVW